MLRIRRVVLWVVAGTFGIAACSRGDTITFSRDRQSFEIEFVTIGNPGNPPDEPDHMGLAMGAVDYVYQIAKHELTSDAFRIGTNAIGGNGPIPGGASWQEMAQLVNWLNTSSGFHAAYRFDGAIHVPWEPNDVGYDADNPIRNSLARFVMPTADEWHKAAYFDPSLGVYYDYALGSNDTPIQMLVPTTNQDEAIYGNGEALVDVMQAGGLSPYGTMGQTGNSNEWEEGFFGPSADGFHAKRTGGQAGIENLDAAHSRQGPLLGGGLRVVSLVPEPSSFALISFGALSLLGFRRR